tara:strand:+ start:1416 stop:2090 length:675 start_codon:yes stop_codon:yes gene_type:complete
MKYIFSIILFLFLFSCSDQKNENIQSLFGVNLFDNVSNYLDDNDISDQISDWDEYEGKVFGILPLPLIQQLPLIEGKEYVRMYDVFLDQDLTIQGIFSFRDPITLNKSDFNLTNNCSLQQRALINRVSNYHDIDKSSFNQQTWKHVDGFFDASTKDVIINDESVKLVIGCVYTPNISSYESDTEDAFNAFLWYSLSSEINFKYALSLMSAAEIVDFNKEMLGSF